MSISDFALIPTLAKAVSAGEVFGRLTVVATGQKPGTYRYFAVCRCRCGSPDKAVRFDSLLDGSISSCGCLHREATTTHGLSKSQHYSRWRGMLDRCNNERCRAWPDYGGRGIKVCERWHDLATFIAELPPGYRDGLEIDRIDNDGDYEPGNVRWVTSQRNAENRRSARMLTFQGKRRSVSHWAKQTGLSRALIGSRLDDLGWSVERALTEPRADRIANMRRAQAQRWVGHTKKAAPPPRIVRRFPFQGAERTTAEISAMTGIPVALLRKRLCERGWSVEKATASAAL